MADDLAIPRPGMRFVSRPRYVQAWLWSPQYDGEGNLMPALGSMRAQDERAPGADAGGWTHPSGVFSPDNGNPSFIATRDGVKRPANGDVILRHADGTASVMKPQTFLQEYEPE